MRKWQVRRSVKRLSDRAVVFAAVMARRVSVKALLIEPGSPLGEWLHRELLLYCFKMSCSNGKRLTCSSMPAPANGFSFIMRIDPPSVPAFRIQMWHHQKWVVRMLKPTAPAGSARTYRLHGLCDPTTDLPPLNGTTSSDRTAPHWLLPTATLTLALVCMANAWAVRIVYKLAFIARVICSKTSPALRRR